MKVFEIFKNLIFKLTRNSNNIGGMAISNSIYEKLLGIHIDNKLTLEPQVRSLCKKASQKLNAFARISFSLKLDKRKLVLNLS